MVTQKSLTELQAWYQSQCNGDWEHSCGIKIETLDNPGWLVTIDLKETELQDLPFKQMVRGTAADNLTRDQDWLVCKVEQQKFVGAGGPFMLETIIAIFLTWSTSMIQGNHP